MRPLLAALTVTGVFSASTIARAEEPPSPTSAPVALEDDARRIVAAVNADENPASSSLVAKPPQQEEAPPQRPRHKGVVVESSLGALTFLGRFRQVAPTAPWFHLQAGYEPFSWLLVFAEGELAFTDTSIAQDPSKARAFPMFGFGGGARLTLHVTDRVATYLQGGLGALKADIANNAFALLGFKSAESLGLQLAGRVGIEWYQVDRHVALGLGVGVRDARGFAKTGGQSDLPLMLDASLALRYTF